MPLRHRHLNGRLASLLRGAALSTLAGGAVLALSGCAFWKIPQVIELAKRSEAFEQTPPDAVMRLLIVGDSTAVGTGASSPSLSLAGLIAADHSGLQIDNRARDGAKFADVVRQLPAAGSSAALRFDIVLVQAGGNDVIRLTDMDSLATHVDQVLVKAKQLAPLVLLMPAGNVGNAPFFYAPLSWWMSKRSRELHRIVADSARRPGVVYIDLFRERDNDPFVLNPQLNAADGLHPSDGGYAEWFSELKRQAHLDARLSAARRAGYASTQPQEMVSPEALLMSYTVDR